MVDGERFWGQVRTGGAHRITILKRGFDGQFTPVGEAVTDERGFFTQTLQSDPLAEYRFTWEPIAPPAETQPAQPTSSAAVQVAR